MKETKELVSLLVALAHLGEAVADGIQGEDSAKLLDAVMKLSPGIAGTDQVLAEIQSATDEQRAELKAHLVAELDLKDDQLEHSVELVAKIAVDLSALLALVKTAKKDPA